MRSASRIGSLVTPLSAALMRTCAAGSRSASGTASPQQALASESPPDLCSTAGCSAGGPCGTWPSHSGSTGCARACRLWRTSTRRARRRRAATFRQHPSSSSDSSPSYCLVAFRLGMIVFRKTVCSSSTDGTRRSTVFTRLEKNALAAQKNSALYALRDEPTVIRTATTPLCLRSTLLSDNSSYERWRARSTPIGSGGTQRY